MATDSTHIRPSADSGRFHQGEIGEGNGVRGSRGSILDDDTGDAFESSFVLPSARAETGAVLERQLLISGGLDDRRLPPTLGDRSARRIAIVLGLFVLGVIGVGSALYLQFEKTQDEWRNRLDASNQVIATTRADNERLAQQQRDTVLRLEKTTKDLAERRAEIQRIRQEAEQTEGELRLARTQVLSLKGEIGDLQLRYRKLESQRVAELGAFLKRSILAPLEQVGLILRPAAPSAGPEPRTRSASNSDTAAVKPVSPERSARGGADPVGISDPPRAE